ncbi:Bone morphoproteintic protein 1 [Sparganum proliferum]
MLPYFRPQKPASPVADTSRSVLLAAFMVILLDRLLLFSLPAASAASQYAAVTTKHVENSGQAAFVRDTALSESDEESTLVKYDDPDSDRPLQRTGDRTLNESSESDVHPETARSQNAPAGEMVHNANASPGSDASKARKLKEQQDHPYGKSAQGGQTETGSIQDLGSPSRDAQDIVEEPRRRSRRAVTADRRHIWPYGIIPYEIGPQFSINARAIIMQAMRAWESVSCLRFVQRQYYHYSYIIFTVLPCGCCAKVGRQSEFKPQYVSIAASCMSEGTVVHELGHVLGLWHEQNRPDRDAYVQIFEENIQPAQRFNFWKLSHNEINSLGEPYDYYSVMHYPSTAHAIPGRWETIRPKQCCPRPQIGQQTRPSLGDIRQVNMLYNCRHRL